MRLKPIGRTVVGSETRAQRRARRVADGARDLLELYDRWQHARKTGGVPIEVVRRQVAARLAAERAARRKPRRKTGNRGKSIS